MGISVETLSLAKNNMVSKNDILNINRPYFCFVDDDGKSNFNDLYTNVLQPRNIVGGLSIVFSKYTIDASGYLTSAEINNYSNNGWDIICHSTDINTLNIETAQSVLNYCDSQITKYGFKNSKIFAYPNGNVGDDKSKIEKLVSQHFDYALNINTSNNCPITLPISNKMDIGRIFIGKTSEITDEVKEYYKKLIDDTFENNKLLIISTHSNSSDQTYLAEVLDYIISNGGEFVSPTTAFKEMNEYIFQDKRIYSTQEKVVGKWYDGRPVYEKGYQFSNIYFGNNTTFTIGLSDIECAWVEDGIFIDDNYMYRMPIISGGGWTILAIIDVNKTTNVPVIRFRASDSYSASPDRKFYFNIRYVKYN